MPGRGLKKLSREEKLLVLREADISGNISETCRKFQISTPYYYKIKDLLWDDYLEEKANETHIGRFEKVAIESTKLRVTVESRAADIVLMALDVIEKKLDNEFHRLDGDEEIKEKLSFKDITNFFMVAAPYLMRSPDGENKSINGNLMQHHTYITNILNQNTLKLKHGNN